MSLFFFGGVCNVYPYVFIYIYICMSDFPPSGVMCIFIILAFCRESRFSMVSMTK